jgi:tetratricopeptide (TPR) repeat protein
MTIVLPQSCRTFRTAEMRPLRLLCATIACSALLPSAWIKPVTAAQAQDSRESAESPNGIEPLDVSDELLQTYRTTGQLRSIEDYDQIIETCLRAVEAPQRPGDRAYATRLVSWALNRRGEMRWDAAFASSQVDEAERQRAIEDFEASLQADPQRWRAQQNLGIAAADSGDWERAISAFERVIEQQPGYANAYFNRGEVRLQTGQLDAALDDYRKAIELDGGQPDFFRSRGNALFELGRFPDAIEAFTRAVELNPQDASRFVDRGDALQSMGRWDEAEQDYRRALTLNRESPEALRNLAWLLATCPDGQRRRGAEAVQLARLANAMAGENAEYRYAETLAAGLAEIGQWPLAEEQMRRALAQAPEEERGGLQTTLEQLQQQQPIRQAPLQ